MLEAAGRLSEARTALQSALALFEPKGNLISAGRAVERIESLASREPTRS